MSRYRRNYEKGGIYFFTLVTYMRQKIFFKPSIEMLRTSFNKIALEAPFRIEAIVVLPDHVHCIWQLPEGDNNFSIRWKKIKGEFSKCYQEKFGKQKLPISASMENKGEVGIWQRRFWEHTIRDENDFCIHCDYIHYNPVKHGYAQTPNHWPYSSFQRFVHAGVYDDAWGSMLGPEFPGDAGGE